MKEYSQDKLSDNIVEWNCQEQEEIQGLSQTDVVNKLNDEHCLFLVECSKNISLVFCLLNFFICSNKNIFILITSLEIRLSF